MATAHPNLTENPIKLIEFRKHYSRKRNGISLWCFIFSLFVYISIFYIFSLSPFDLLNSTRFWFFMSNTLILIIAADFGAFFSSKNPDFDRDNLKATPLSSSDIQSLYSIPADSDKTVNVVESYRVIPRPNSDENKKTIQEKVIYEVTPHDETVFPLETHHAETVAKETKTVAKDVKTVANDIPTVAKDTKTVAKDIIIDAKDTKTVAKDIKTVAKFEAPFEGKNNDEAMIKWRRTNSDVVNVKFEDNKDEKNGLIQRSQSERYDAKNIEENYDEFSEMSVEELNRRVEEFIQRFNRQIRLQAAESRRKNNEF